MAYCEAFMKEAIRLARQSAAEHEVPVGAVIVKNGQIIATGKNQREKTHSALAHAEIVAIQKANRVLSDWRLSGCEMYVTLEPCPMCAGALYMARLSRLYFGAYDKANGAFCNGMLEMMDKVYDVYGGLCETECQTLLSDFFLKNR